MMLDLTIVGGGIQGTTIARALLATKAVDPERLAVLDPHEIPLALWYRQTAACGTTFLRSPSSHNVDLDFRALRRFALAEGYDPAEHFRPPYRRPSLALFNSHSRHVAEERALLATRRRGRLGDLRPIAGAGKGWHLETDRGHLRTRTVILAVGKTEKPYIPPWADALPEIAHVFEPEFRRPDPVSTAGRIGIVGGGITGGQLALSLARELPSSVKIILFTGGAPEVRQFDSLPCYLGPRCLESYLRLEDAEERRRIIRSVRFPGSIPPAIAGEVQRLREEGRLLLNTEWVTGARRSATGVSLSLESGEGVVVDRAILATGFSPAPPLESVVASLSAEIALPRTADGYPIPDATLQWAPGLFLAGPLGETELGPGAPNIIGGHLAVRRIVPFLRSEPTVAWRPVRIAVA